MLKLLSRGVMKRILVTLIIFEIILISYVNIIFYPKIREGNRAFAEAGLEKLLKEKRSGLESLFNQVENEVENLGLWVKEVIEQEISQKDLDDFYNKYYVNENSILTNYIREENNSNFENIDSSNVFFSYDSNLKQSDINDIINTSKLEKQFKKTIDTIPYSQWVYVITKNDMIRIYPSKNNNINNFEYEHEFENDVYYFIANEKNNSERKAVWTNPYIDYLGKGLVITCSYPIYKGDTMLGVVSIDIGLEGIKNGISDLSIEGKGISFLVDKEGRIIYYPGYEIDKAEKGLVVKDSIDIFSTNQNEYNIYKQMLEEKQGMKLYGKNDNEGIERLLIYDKIEKLNWIIGIRVDSKDYIQDNIIFTDNIWSLIIFSALLIILLLIYFYNSLSKPMFNLVDEIQDMGKKYIPNFETNNKSDEIKILDEAFKDLKSELDNHINDLYYKNNEFQTIFDNMPGILYIRDVDCNILMINSKGIKAIEEKNFNFKEKKCYELFFDRREICDNCPIEKSLNRKNEYQSEVQNKGKIYDISCFPIFNINGTIREIIVYSLDKTNEIMKNLELANAEKFALIGQVAAGVTHELKNNLSVIKGVYYLLNDIEIENDFNIREIRGIIFELKESIKNAESTVHSLLKFSNRNGDVFTKVNVISIIDQILILEKNNFYRNKIKVIKNYDEHSLVVYASDNSLKFIFTNIVKNALEAMKGDGGNLIINAYKNQDYIYIEIIDTGKGMEDNIKVNIFEPFVSTKEKGYGLGLWIAKNQVKKLNGNIYCESKKNIGSKFIIVLPLNKES